MKKFLVCALFGCLAMGIMAQAAGKGAIDAIMSSYSARIFTTVPVSAEQLRTVLECGLKAPSAMNSQTWRFTVIKDLARGEKIVGDFLEGNVLICVSGPDQRPPGVDVVFDCALASENMYIAAQALGLGAHFYAMPINDLNKSMKKVLAIPKGNSVIMILKIGNVEKKADGMTSASMRMNFKDAVN
jgi:nitroreductase